MNDQGKIFSALIIDDDKNHIKEMTRLFSGVPFWMKAGRDFCFAGNEARAITIYTELYKDNRQPDLVFISLDSPEIDGFLILEKIRKINKDACFIIFSKQAKHELVLKSRMAGAYGFILRPVTRETLDTYIQRYFQDMVIRKVDEFFGGSSRENSSAGELA